VFWVSATHQAPSGLKFGTMPFPATGALDVIPSKLFLDSEGIGGKLRGHG
jgi:hypothetical protein